MHRARFVGMLTAVGLGLAAAPVGAWEWNDLRLRGRLQARYQAYERAEDWGHHLELQRARLDARWKALDWLRLTLETELGEGDVELRDAVLELTPHPAAAVTVGHFKKPFSRLRLDSPFELPVAERGLMDRYAVGRSRHGGYGGRDLGVMLSGEVSLPARLKLRYALGVWNSLGELFDRGEAHHDYAARVGLRVWKGLWIGLNACHKLVDVGDRRLTVNAFGGDVRFRHKGLGLQLEVNHGDRIDSGPGRRFLGGHLLARYRIALGEDLALEPAAMVELFDADDGTEGGLSVRLGGQLNLHLNRHLRLGLYADGALSPPEAWDPLQARAVPLEWPLRVGVQLTVGI